MKIQFLNPEYFFGLTLIPLIILWFYFNKNKINTSLKFSNIEGFNGNTKFYKNLKFFSSLFKSSVICLSNYFPC